MRILKIKTEALLRLWVWKEEQRNECAPPFSAKHKKVGASVIKLAPTWVITVTSCKWTPWHGVGCFSISVLKFYFQKKSKREVCQWIIWLIMMTQPFSNLYSDSAQSSLWYLFYSSFLLLSQRFFPAHLGHPWPNIHLLWIEIFHTQPHWLHFQLKRLWEIGVYPLGFSSWFDE